MSDKLPIGFSYGEDILLPGFTAKGELVTYDGVDNVNLSVGTDGQVLVADSSEANGLKWDTASSLLTTKGDLLTDNGSTDVRLPVGTDGQVLVADSSEANGLKWASSLFKTVFMLRDTPIIGNNLLTIGNEDGWPTAYVARMPQTLTEFIFYTDDMHGQAAYTGSIVIRIYKNGSDAATSYGLPSSGMSTAVSPAGTISSVTTTYYNGLNIVGANRDIVTGDVIHISVDLSGTNLTAGSETVLYLYSELPV